MQFAPVCLSPKQPLRDQPQETDKQRCPYTPQIGRLEVPVPVLNVRAYAGQQSDEQNEPNPRTPQSLPAQASISAATVAC